MTIQEREFAKRGSSSAPSDPARRSSTPRQSQPSHEQIAARARAIWEAKGCPAGQDEENWRQAEAELRTPSRGGL